MIRHQRHYSDPFVCHENLLITESTMCLRRGSASMVEMVQCRMQSLTKTTPLPCLRPLQEVSPANSTESRVHDTNCLYANSAQKPSLLSPFLLPHQHSHHDSASHFDSPHLPLNLQPPAELPPCVPRSPGPHHHCKACMSLLCKDRTKGGGSLGHTQKRTDTTSTQFAPVSKPSSPTSLHQPRSPPSLPTATSSNCQPVVAASPSHLSPPSQNVFPRSLYEGGDLTLLNYCLHHIVSRRTSSPTLSDRGVNHPLHNHGDAGVCCSSVREHKDKSQSLDAPFYCSPNVVRNLQLSSHHSKDRANSLVG